LILSLLAGLLAASPAASQLSSTHGSLAVTAIDSSGAVIVGAQVDVTHLGRGWSRSLHTDQVGRALFAALQPGHYEVAIDAPNFSPVRSEVDILLGHEASLRFTLHPAALHESITVTGPSADSIDAATTSIHSHIDTSRIEGLPINQRNFLDFSLLDPGIQRDALRVHAVANTSGFNVMGQRPRSNSLQLDGSDMNDETTGGVRYGVPMEAVQEFLVLPGGYQVEYGRASGGVVNVVTKSGGNEFHGSVFGFLRHRSLDATNAFSPVDNPPYTRTQYGVSASGPIRRDRTFFFLGLEQLRRQESGFSQIGLQPSVFQLTEAQRQLKGTDPSDPAVQQAERGLALAQGGTDPATGLPPGYGITPLERLGGVHPVGQHWGAYSLRLDHSLNHTQRAAVRLNYAHDRVSTLEPQNNDQIAGLLSFGRTAAFQAIDPTAVASLSSVFGPRIVNEVRVAWSRRQFQMLPNSTATPVNVPGAAFIGREAILPHRRDEQHGHIQEILMVNSGNHLIKAGGDWMYCPMEIDYHRELYGLFTFGPRAAPGAAAGSPLLTPVQAYGLGLPTNYVQQFGQPFAPVSRSSAGVFLQDTWHAGARLSLELGVRYDVERVPPEKPADSAWEATFRRLGIRRSPATDWNNVQPRIGFNYRLSSSGRFAIRGSYGLFYDRLLGLPAYLAKVGDGSQITRSILTGEAATAVFRLPDQRLPSRPASGPPTGLIAFDSHWRLGYTQQANLTLAAELRRDLTLDAGYVLVRGVGLPRSRDFNAPDAQRGAKFLAAGHSLAQLLAENYFRPESRVSEVMGFEPSARSVYHGLRLNLRGGLTPRWLLQASYAFSRALDDAEEMFPHTRAQNMLDFRSERGPALYDQRHRLVVSSIWEPLGRWSIAPIFEASSGRPVNVLLGFDNNLDQFPASDRPDVAGAGAAGAVLTKYGAFTVPAPGVSGNLGRNAFFGPGYVSLNLRLQRRLEVKDQFSAEVTIEGFNILNRVNVRTVNPNYEHAGEPLSAFDPRQIQVGLRFRF
jgi:hypothetical protein